MNPAEEATDPLQEVLGQLRQAGKLDSSGSFTLDLNKSLDKLSQFQLEDPRRYVHYLVAAAYAKGATFIQFEVGPRDVLACFDGESFSHHDLVNLFHTLFESSQSRAGRAANHLAFALNVTRQIGAQFVAFDTFGESEGSRLQLTSGLLQVAPLAKKPWSEARITNRFHLHEPIDPDFLKRVAEGVGRRLSGSSRSWPEHEFLVNGRCGFCPVQIWVNGQLIKPPLDAVLECWVGDDLQLRPPSVPSSIPVKEQAFCGGVGLCREHFGCIFWVVDGVAFRDVMERTLPKEIAFWIYSDLLKTDVSRQYLVQGPELLELRRRVFEIAPQVLPQLQSELRENPRAVKKYTGFAQATLAGGKV